MLLLGNWSISTFSVSTRVPSFPRKLRMLLSLERLGSSILSQKYLGIYTNYVQYSGLWCMDEEQRRRNRYMRTRRNIHHSIEFKCPQSLFLIQINTIPYSHILLIIKRGSCLQCQFLWDSPFLLQNHANYYNPLAIFGHQSTTCDSSKRSIG